MALFPLIISVLGMVLLTKRKDLDRFLLIIIAFSMLAAINGIKQLYIGPSAGEQRFLDAGGSVTHLIWGQLRVFSFYSDAGQFGASQAHLSLMCLILAFGKMSWWKRILLIMLAGILFYGMLISGTRGALFVLLSGGFFALLLSKRISVILVGGCLVVLFIAFLKFTHIGSSNYQIYRLRSALDTHDASLNVRLQNQQLLANYLQDKPFGDGLGTIGKWGKEYNPDKFLSTIEPDSLWVKIWASYGIVGLICWFAFMMFLLGQCCGICLRIKDRNLRIKVIALTSGIAGIIFCSYGNEVMNAFPSSAITWLSCVLVYLSPTFDVTTTDRKLSQEVPDSKGIWILKGDLYQYVTNSRSTHA
ncbi:hypothetical protein GCM10023231_03120 [Olivibacter ginsenosidimutans]|uniref:O-antigen ligase-related domain-containing protein n=2 Tax=Olivibacter ginsenosidimutans TaxID=1176537 RepID=A0ABP9AGJ5_9SPHI